MRWRERIIVCVLCAYWAAWMCVVVAWNLHGWMFILAAVPFALTLPPMLTGYWWIWQWSRARRGLPRKGDEFWWTPTPIDAWIPVAEEWERP